MPHRRVDPDRRREIGGLRRSLHEALGVRRVGGGEDALPVFADGRRLTEMHGGGRQKAQAAVTMFTVVPGEEDLAKGAAIGERATRSAQETADSTSGF